MKPPVYRFESCLKFMQTKWVEGVTQAFEEQVISFGVDSNAFISLSVTPRADDLEFTFGVDCRTPVFAKYSFSYCENKFHTVFDPKGGSAASHVVQDLKSEFEKHSLLYVSCSFTLETSVAPEQKKEDNLMAVLYASRESADYHFKLEKEQIRIHSFILGAVSPFYKTIFDNACLEATLKYSDLKDDFSAEVVNMVVDSIYEVSPRQSYSLICYLEAIRFAHKYDIQIVLSRFKDDVNQALTTLNFVFVANYAYKYCLEELKHLCVNSTVVNPFNPSMIKNIVQLNPVIIKDIIVKPRCISQS